MSSPALSSDTVCLMGTVSYPESSARPTLHRVFSLTRADLSDLDCLLCGHRASWIIWLDAEPPPEDLMNRHLKPILFASSIEDMQRRQAGVPRLTHPVIYHAPMTRLLPPDEQAIS